MGRRFLLLIPYTFWFFFLVIGPFALIITVSFLERDNLGQLQNHFVFNAYKEIFADVFIQTGLRTLFMALANTICTILLAYPLAFYIASQKGNRQIMLLSLVLIPFWTNYLIRVLAFMDFLRLEPFGFALLFTREGVLSALVYTYLPFALLPLYSNMKNIDFSHFEAARDLGANNWQVFKNVLWPLTRGGVANAALFIFVPSLGEYLVPELLSGGKFYMLGSLLQHQFSTARNWPAGAALIVLIVFALISVFLVGQKKHE